MARREMTKAHKAALARGREQGRAVRDYLEALSQERRPGRPVDADTLGARIQRLQEQIDEEPNAAKRVDLIQRRLDAEVRLAALEERVDLTDLEDEFKAAVAEYSDRKGISYSAWREAGVPAAVLRDAGIARTRRT